MNIGQLNYTYRQKVQKQIILPHCPVYKIQTDKMEWYFPSQGLITLKKKLQNTSLAKFCSSESEINQQLCQNQAGSLLILKQSSSYLMSKLKHILNDHSSQVSVTSHDKDFIKQKLVKCSICDSYQVDYRISCIKLAQFNQLLKKQSQNNNNQLSSNSTFQTLQKIVTLKQIQGVDNQQIKQQRLFHIIKLKQKSVHNYQKKYRKMVSTSQQNRNHTQLNKNQIQTKQKSRLNDEIIQVEWTNNYLLLNHFDIKSNKRKDNQQQIKMKKGNINEHMKQKLSQKCQQLSFQIQNYLKSLLLINNIDNLSQNQKQLKQNSDSNLNNNEYNIDKKQGKIIIQSFRLWGYLNSQNMQIYTILVSDIKFKIFNQVFQLYSKINLNQIQKTHIKSRNTSMNQFQNQIQTQQIYEKQDDQIGQCKCCKTAIKQAQSRKIVNNNIQAIQLFKKIKICSVIQLQELYDMVDVCQDCYQVFLNNVYKSQNNLKEKLKQKIIIKRDNYPKQTIKIIKQKNIYKQKQGQSKLQQGVKKVTENTQISLNKNNQTLKINQIKVEDINLVFRKSTKQVYRQKLPSNSKSIYQSSNVSTIGTSLAYSTKGSKGRRLLSANRTLNQQPDLSQRQSQKNQKYKNKLQLPPRQRVLINKMHYSKFIKLNDSQNVEQKIRHQVEGKYKVEDSQSRQKNYSNAQKYEQFRQNNQIQVKDFVLKQMIKEEILSYVKFDQTKQINKKKQSKVKAYINQLKIKLKIQ